MFYICLVIQIEGYIKYADITQTVLLAPYIHNARTHLIVIAYRLYEPYYLLQCSQVLAQLGDYCGLLCK